MRMDPITANSIASLVLSLEAVALRVRRSIGSPDAHRVLGWSKAELERLMGEVAELEPAAREAVEEGL